MQFYNGLKSEPGREKYLLGIANVKHRQSLSRFRLSSHSLNIETGRHRGIARENRTCPLCGVSTEDETHFLLGCPSYDNIKTKYPNLFAKLPPLDELGKVQFLMSENNIKETASFIHGALNHRDIVIDVQSTMVDMISKIESWEKKTQVEGAGKAGRKTENIPGKEAGRDEGGIKIRIKLPTSKARKVSPHKAIKLKIKLPKAKDTEIRRRELLEITSNLQKITGSLLHNISSQSS